MRILLRLLACVVVFAAVHPALPAAQMKYGARDQEKEAKIEQALRATHPELVAPFHAATALFDQSKYAEAGTLYAQVTAAAPEFDAAQRRLGTCLFQQGKKADGIAACERAIRLNRSAANLSTLGTNLAIPVQGEPTKPDQIRAVDLLREALRLPDGDDDSTLVVVAQLAWTLDRREVFRDMVVQLRARDTDQPAAHYFSAIQHALDEEWLRAENEVHRAVKLGLPAEVGQRFLDSGVHSRAAGWRLALYAGGTLGAWLGGLVLLFTLGFLLSKIVLRHTRTMDVNTAVSAGERRLRSFYRAVINIGGIYYYISLPVVVVMVIGATGAIFYGFLAIGWIPIKLTIILAIGAIATIWSMLRSLFLKVKSEDPGRALTRDEAPALWQLTEEVAQALNTRPIDEIRLTPGTDLAVYERGSWRDKLQNRARRILILGTGVLDGFKQDEFRSVLAHEYGHFSNRDTAGGDIALRVRNDMMKFYVAMYQAGQATYLNVAFHFLRAYNFIFRRISHGATRLQEVLADRVAAQTYGAPAFEGGLRHVIARSIEFHANAEREIDAGLKAKRPLQNLYESNPEGRAQHQGEFEKAINRETTEDDTHPSPVDRFRMFAAIRNPTCAPRPGEVWELFKDREAIVKEMMATIEAQVKRHRD